MCGNDYCKIGSLLHVHVIIIVIYFSHLFNLKIEVGNNSMN